MFVFVRLSVCFCFPLFVCRGVPPDLTLNKVAFSDEPNLQHMFTMMGLTSPSEQSMVVNTIALSLPACSLTSVPDLTKKLQHTFSVLSRRMSMRILPLSLCLRSFRGPTPRSFHSPSTKRYAFDLASKRMSSFSSPDATSTCSSLTRGVNSALHSASTSVASSVSSPSAAAALGAEAKAVGSKVAAAPPNPPAAPKPKMGAAGGVSSFFSSACGSPGQRL